MTNNETPMVKVITLKAKKEIQSILTWDFPISLKKKKKNTFIVSIIIKKMINREYRKNIMTTKKKNKKANSMFRKLDYIDFKPSKFKEKLLLLSENLKRADTLH